MNQLRASMVPIFSLIQRTSSLPGRVGQINSFRNASSKCICVDGLSRPYQIHRYRFFSSSKSDSDHNYEGVITLNAADVEATIESNEFVDETEVETSLSSKDIGFPEDNLAQAGVVAKEVVAADPHQETITDRLFRLSQTSSKEYQPPAFRTPEQLRRAKARYSQVLDDYENKNFSRDEFIRQRARNNSSSYRQNNNWENNNDSWRNNRRGDMDFQKRWFSTASRVFQEESIVERLKRMSSGKDYQPSAGAQARAKLAASNVRDDVQDEDFDQKRARHNQNQHKRSYSGESTPSHSSSYDETRPRRQYSGDRKHDFSNREDFKNRKFEPNENGARERRSNSWSGGNRDRDRDRDESSGYQRKQYNSNDRTQYSNRNNRGQNKEGYRRVFRRETDDEIKVKQYGRNYEYNDSQNNMNKTRNFDKPSSTSMVGDYSSTLASSKVKEQSANNETDLDLSSVLNHTDADTFGTLSIGPVPVKDYVGASLKKELMQDEAQLGLTDMYEDEEDDTKFLPERDEKWTMERLTRRVKQLVDEMKVKEAVDTVMSALEKGGFEYHPTKFLYIYNLLISSCAQVGYVKMAFKLFNDMKKRGFINPPRESTYTSLFNACSNSTWDAENNIQRMNRLRESMLEKGINPNQIIYHAMIKGYGRNGDIESAFGIVDEMINQGQISPNTETFNMLLQACITNTENGFRHVLVTWRKLQQMKIRPDIYTYNLLLRAVRECGILPEPQFIEGDPPEGIVTKKKAKNSSEMQLFLPPVTSDEESNDMLNLLCLNDSSSLVRINERMQSESSSVSQARSFSYTDLIDALKQPQNRLTVFGGLRGFVSEMASNKVGPNLKTVTEMGQIIHPSEIGDLIMMMKTYKLNPDITFFNLMMKRYYDTNNPVGAKKLINCLPQFRLVPNIMTWGISATGCKTKILAKQMVEEMDAANFTPNIQIMGALLSQATKSFDPTYVYWVMEEINHREIKTDTKFLLTVEEFKQTVRKGIISKEMDKPIQPDKLAEILENDSEQFLSVWKTFSHRYDSWMQKTPVELLPSDPWNEDFETFKKHRTHGTLSKEDEDSQQKKPEQVITNAVKSS